MVGCREALNDLSCEYTGRHIIDLNYICMPLPTGCHWVEYIYTSLYGMYVYDFRFRRAIKALWHQNRHQHRLGAHFMALN